MKYFLALPLLALAQPIAAEKGSDCCITGIMAPVKQVDLRPGESIIFRPDKGIMREIRMVKGNIAPGPGEVRMDFSVEGGQTMLVAKNGGGSSFNYSAWILKKPGKKNGKRTSVCTLIGGISAFESWPYAIKAIRVGNFIASDDGMISCR